jgi:hypothetical protein
MSITQVVRDNETWVRDEAQVRIVRSMLSEASGADKRAVRIIRSMLSEVFGATPSSALVLSPGVLVSLRLLLAALGVKRLVISDEEYYTPLHFPDCKTTIASVGALGRRANDLRADAVLGSLMSWRGVPTDTSAIAKEIRATRRGRRPLVIVDFTHAGAIGFPNVTSSGADIVCGDAGKWITPLHALDHVGFLWTRGAALRTEMRRTFEGFYLATSNAKAAIFARWLDPQHVNSLAAYIRNERITKKLLLAEHKANLAVSADVCRTLGISSCHSGIVWSSRTIRPSVLRAVRGNLAFWQVPGGGTRILCRSPRKDRIRGEEIGLAATLDEIDDGGFLCL